MEEELEDLDFVVTGGVVFDGEEVDEAEAEEGVFGFLELEFFVEELGESGGVGGEEDGDELVDFLADMARLPDVDLVKLELW